jgi:arylsulfatase A-like enzyme
MKIPTHFLKRLFILLAGYLLVACGNETGPVPPNVIVVLADDIGLGDISFYRRMHTDNIIIETPNIDALAVKGMAFTDAHSPAALCAPSRFALMTGNSCYRSPRPWGVWGAYEKSPIAKDQLTLGKLMKQAGFRTAFFGKWHLGGDFYRKDDPETIYRGPRNKPELDVDITKYAGSGPSRQGFDYSLTLPAGIQNVPYAVYENEVWMPLAEDSEIGYISQENMTKIGVKLDKSEGLGDLNWDPHYIGPLLANKAVDFIRSNAGKDAPFFMYYCSQAVHLPHAPPEELNGVKIAGTTPSRHMDMIRELDVQMGMLVDALKEKGVYENTLFIFTSDNGGLLRRETLHSGHQPSDIYRGGKNSCYEGGHRVPFIACWPERIEEGQISSEPVLGLDVLATLASITGQVLPADQAMDSHDLLPLLENRPGGKGHDFLMLQSGTGRELILIEDGWKLIMKENPDNATGRAGEPFALFNLRENPTEDEAFNLIHDEHHQQRVAEMSEKYQSIRESGEMTVSRSDEMD